MLDSIGAPPGETGGTLYFRVPEQSSDGDDAMEGNGGGDVDSNPRLRTIVAEAKANNMPRENIVGAFVSPRSRLP